MIAVKFEKRPALQHIVTLETFQQQAQHYGQAHKAMARKYAQIAILRAVFFVLGLIVLVYLANARLSTAFAISLLLFLVVFGALVRWHQQIAWQRNYLGHMADIQQEEMMRLNGQLAAIPANGSAFADPMHPYANDLDIFGNHSLFQLLNRTVTPSGQHTLAQWLLGQTTAVQALYRQKAVQEQACHPLAVQEFQALGRFGTGTMQEVEKLTAWLAKPATFRWMPAWQAVGIVSPLALATAGLATFWYDLPNWTFGLPLLLNFLLLGLLFKRVTEMAEETAKSAQMLKPYQKLMALVTAKTYQAGKNQEIRKVLLEGNAPEAIGQLARYVAWLEARNNLFFYITVNTLSLYELHLALRLTQWKQQHGLHVANWLKALGEYDALNSMAGFAQAQPGFAYPTFSELESPFVFEAQQLGHPLIASGKRVCNDIAFQGAGTILLVTGSNMSGKSTFLRTVGINTVLAFAGSPVCATALTVSEIQVFSGMRIQDSLSEDTSAFYAELKRLKALLDLLAQGVHVLFMLDEILKGTNTHDRHLGVKALIGQLTARPCFGLVSTHDLELASLEKEYPGQVMNYSFNSKLSEEGLVFPYQLEKGVCYSFSASKLMEMMGLISRQ